MFNVSSADHLTDGQLWLLHWIQTYNWVFTLPAKERPSDAVIEDDARFDAWHQSYIAKQLSEQRSGYSPNSKAASSHKNVISF